jgi:citrate lyase subunit beta / citryl-CoA lyase
MPLELPVWRSLMYCPVNVEKYVERAHTRGADVIQLDLEDSVPLAEKAAVRKLVEKAAARVRRGGADVVVRFNQPLSLAVRDLEHAIGPDVDALACTKIGGMSHVQLLDELVSELEEKRGMPVGHTKFIVMVETAAAFFKIRDIVRAQKLIARYEAIKKRESRTLAVIEHKA